MLLHLPAPTNIDPMNHSQSLDTQHAAWNTVSETTTTPTESLLPPVLLHLVEGLAQEHKLLSPPPFFSSESICATSNVPSSLDCCTNTPTFPLTLALSYSCAPSHFCIASASPSLHLFSCSCVGEHMFYSPPPLVIPVSSSTCISLAFGTRPWIPMSTQSGTYGRICIA